MPQKKILITDDSKSMRDLYTHYITKGNNNYSVIHAETAKETLEIYTTEKIDAMLLDFVLPDGNGLEIIKKLAKDKGKGKLPIILITCYGSPELIKDTLKAGAYDYIHKDRLDAESLSYALASAIQFSEDQNTLIEKQTEIETFSHVIAHDLRTPIAGMISLLDLLSKEVKNLNNDKINECITHLDTNCKYANQMISDLYSYSTLGQGNLECTALDCNDIIKKIQTILKEEITLNKSTIFVQPIPMLYANETLIQQLFSNLIHNAIKYSNQSAEIEIGHIALYNQDVIFVKDNGIGIAEKDLETIFLRFMRSSNSTETEGSGLGLSTCKKIIERYDGRIWAESTPGEGSCFYFYIPSEQ